MESSSNRRAANPATILSQQGTYRIRRVEERDVPFLWEMLFASLYVKEGEAPFKRQVLEEPYLRKYVEGWGREGDFGVLAESLDGVALGSATARIFPANNRGFGYVAPDVPELGMALVEAGRWRGIGTALMQSLLDGLQEQGVQRVSLSVDPDNVPAMKLYTRFGFKEVGWEGTSMTMVVDLGHHDE